MMSIIPNSVSFEKINDGLIITDINGRIAPTVKTSEAALKSIKQNNSISCLILFRLRCWVISLIMGLDNLKSLKIDITANYINEGENYWIKTWSL